MTHHHTLTDEEAQALAEAGVDFDMQDSTDGMIVWLDGKHGPQAFLWLMRLKPRGQGNLSNPAIRGMWSYSPREDH